jgi:hypothetical protein
MTGWNVVLLVSVLVAADLVVLGAVLTLAGQTWKRFVAKYPGQAELPGAERRRRQSISHGICNWGWCFTITRDVGHVHLEPGSFAGRFLGRQRASIPLEQLVAGMPAQIGPERIPGSYVAVKLGMDTLKLPRWVFQ